MRELPVALLSLALGGVAAGCSRLALSDPGIPGGPPSAPPLESDHPTVGLVSAVGGVGRALVGWGKHESADASVSLALFVGDAPDALFAGPPLIEDPPGKSAILEGLVDDAVLFVGLAIRASPADPWTPSGPVLRVRTGAAIYVDPAAPSGGDGTTPETALNDLALGILTSYFVYGGGNVWVKGGQVVNASLPLYGGVYLSGGFDDSMSLDLRDPAQHVTRITGSLSQSIIDLRAGNGACVLDGFDLDGLTLSTNGVQDLGQPAELRSLSIENCERGIKLRTLQTGPTVPVLVSGALVQASVLEGLSADGPFDCTIEFSTFRLNGREGTKFNDLYAPELGSASVRVRGASFDRNGDEGLEIRLRAPPGSGSGGGRFEIGVLDCDFILDGLAGLVMNIDYEGFPQWTSGINVRGCVARANQGPGVELHLDSTSTCFVERLSSTANEGDGLLVTSTTLPVMATVCGSAFVANRGAGVHALAGQAGVLMSGCVVSGNLGGGVLGVVVPPVAISSVAYIQPQAWTNVLTLGSASQDVALPEPFLRVAREYVVVAGATGADLILGSAPILPSDGPVEIEDDGVGRLVVSLAGAALTVDPPPDPFPLPGVVGFFGPGAEVLEDFHLAPGSVAVGAGLAAPGGPPIDAGIFSLLSAGPPGKGDPVPASPFFLGSTSPPWSDPTPPGSELTLVFVGGRPASATVPFGVFAVDAQGVPLPITGFVDAGTVKVNPPPRGWAAGDVVEIFPSLRSSTGQALAATMAIPIRVP